jgi:hypothetical protein
MIFKCSQRVDQKGKKNEKLKIEKFKLQKFG